MKQVSLRLTDCIKKDEIDTMMMRLQSNVALMQRPHTLAQRVGADNNEPEFHQTYRVVREEPKTAGHEIVKQVGQVVNPIGQVTDLIRDAFAHNLQSQTNDLAKLDKTHANELNIIKENNNTHLAGLREGYAHEQAMRDAELAKLDKTHADNQEAREEETKQIQKKHEKEMHEATQITEQHRIKADAEIAGHQKEVDKAWAEVERTKARPAELQKQIDLITAEAPKKIAEAEAAKAASEAAKAAAHLAPHVQAAKRDMVRWIAGSITAVSSIIGGSVYMTFRNPAPAPQAPQQLEHQLEQQIQRQAPKVLKQLK
jgi:hypothetical protein